MMFDHALIVLNLCCLFRRLVAFIVVRCASYCTFHLEKFLRLPCPTKIVIMWLAIGDGSGDTKPTKI